MGFENDHKKELIQFEKLIQGLIDNDYGYCDDFTNQSLTSGLRNKITDLKQSDKMQISGIGNKNNFQKNHTVRGDNIKWIDEKSEDHFEILFQKKIRNFMNYLNNTCYTSIKSFESHYASYPINSFYKRHLDQFKNDDSRKFSLILYLNRKWDKEDAGHLTLYVRENKPVNILPKGGRMVFFKSGKLEHEVHPSTTKNRISIAGWFK